MKVIRGYVLKLYGSKSKFEDLNWSSYQYSKMTNSFINHFYFDDDLKYYSTKGLGLLGNQAQQKALGIVKSKKSNEKNGHKRSIPFQSVKTCFGKINKQSSNAHYDYKISFPVAFADEFSKSRIVFAKGIKPLKQSIKQGWKLSGQCEFFLNEKNNHWYVRVFVSKEVLRAIPRGKSIGIDVGIRNIVSTSEGYLGNSLLKKIKKLNESKKEKQKQFNLAKNRRDFVLIEKLTKNLTKNKNINKTIIKQLLDKEAKRIVARGQYTLSNLIVEDPKVLSNLKGNKFLVRWARTYFAYRLEVLGKEKEVYVKFVNPAYTSLICYKCKEKDMTSRDGLRFNCLKCGNKDHSDINASKNLAQKGQDFIDTHVLKVKPKNLISKIRELE